MKLNIIDEIPNEILTSKVSQLQQKLHGPTLIHLNKNLGSPLFISTLLHGNEHSGFLALQKILKQIVEKSLILKRSLIIFIGNTLAAEQNKRRLENQIDFNRIWGTIDGEMSHISQQVLRYVKKEKLFCSVDIHNNTGKNPFYSCLNQTDKSTLNLAKLFSSKIVYFSEPHTVLCKVFSQFCPSITIEAGLSGDKNGIDILESKIKKLLEVRHLENELGNELGNTEKSIGVYHTVACMKFSSSATFDFLYDKNSSHEFSFIPNIEDMNFVEQKIGNVWAWIKNLEHLKITNDFNEDVFNQYFALRDKKLVAISEFTPSMLNTNVEVIHQDCFGYIMKEEKVIFS